MNDVMRRMCSCAALGGCVGFRRRSSSSSSMYTLCYPVIEFLHSGDIVGCNSAALQLLTRQPESLLDIMSFRDAGMVIDSVNEHYDAWWNGTCLKLSNLTSGDRMSGQRFLMVVSRSPDKRASTLSLVQIAAPVRTMLETWFKHQLPSSLIASMAEQNDNLFPVTECFATIMFVDIVGFTSMASRVGPGQVFLLLKNVFGMIETEILKYPRIITYETDGDCWIGISGIAKKDCHSGTFAVVESSNEDSDGGKSMFKKDAVAMITVACVIRTACASVRMPDGSPLKLRFGVHSGDVVVGFISSRMKIAGDTINTAKRVESSCPPGCINMSEVTYNLLPMHMKVLCKPHTAELKGKGTVSMYCLP